MPKNDYRDYVQHGFFSRKNHKYIMKIGEGKFARYFYTPQEVDAYKRAKAGGSKGGIGSQFRKGTYGQKTPVKQQRGGIGSQFRSGTYGRKRTLRGRIGQRFQRFAPSGSRRRTLGSGANESIRKNSRPQRNTLGESTRRKIEGYGAERRRRKINQFKSGAKERYDEFTNKTKKRIKKNTDSMQPTKTRKASKGFDKAGRGVSKTLKREVHRKGQEARKFDIKSSRKYTNKGETYRGNERHDLTRGGRKTGLSYENEYYVNTKNGTSAQTKRIRSGKNYGTVSKRIRRNEKTGTNDTYLDLGYNVNGRSGHKQINVSGAKRKAKKKARRAAKRIKERF